MVEYLIEGVPPRRLFFRIRWRERVATTNGKLMMQDDMKGVNHAGADSTSDSGDMAFDTSSDEMSSQLAELDDRELNQIERALARLTQGT